jgi:sugar phosphate isomerase/epimerase
MLTPTLFSVSYAGLWGQHRLDLPAFIHKAGQLGYRAVELMGKRPHLSILDTDERQIGQIRDAASAAGVEIATIAGYTNFTLGLGTEVPAAEFQIAYVRQLAAMAELLGAKIVRVFTGYATEPEAYGKDWDACVRAVRECAEAAAQHGVVLGLQNHHDVGAAVDSYIEFLDDVDHPNCRAMFDPWAPALHGEDLRAAARRLAPRMVQTTLADYVRLPRWAYQPGLGQLQATGRHGPRRSAGRRVPGPGRLFCRLARGRIRRLRRLRNVFAAAGRRQRREPGSSREGEPRCDRALEFTLSRGYNRRRMKNTLQRPLQLASPLPANSAERNPPRLAVPWPVE